MNTTIRRTANDWPDVVVGGQLTGVSVEVEHHEWRLRREADAARLVATSPSGLRYRIGRGLVRLGTALEGTEPPLVMEAEASC